MKKKLLIVSPHFSTGGAPQVTLNKIQLLINDYDIKVVEYSLLAWQFVVQRNQVIQLVGEDNFITLSGGHDDKIRSLFNLICEWNPSVIFMEEFPEMFSDTDGMVRLYERCHNMGIKMVESTHDSSFPIVFKSTIPNQFVFVSRHTQLKYAYLNVPTEVIEYPVDYQDISYEEKKDAREKLGLCHSLKHVVIVGLFTPRKNQAYAIQLAKLLSNSDIQFHFLGNQAENFKQYWKPLMDTLPNNCVVWGERNDVDTFIRASDVFLFPSKGEPHNKELNPIVIKEASKYPKLPKLIYNLEVYMDKYNTPDFNFLTGNETEDAIKLCMLCEGHSDLINTDELIVIGTYPNLNERKILTKECINSLKYLRRKIMLVSHYPVSQDIQEMVDYYIYDSHNPLTFHSYYTKFFNYSIDYDAEININGLKNSNQSFAVLTNLLNAFKSAKNLGYKKLFYITYDVVVKSEDYKAIENSFKSINEVNKAYLAYLKTPFGFGLQTTAMTFDVDTFLNKFDDLRNPEDYNSACEKLPAHNFLEDYMYKLIQQRFAKGTYTVVINDKETFLQESGVGVSSNSEYYSIIPISDCDNQFMFYFYTYNIDNRRVYVNITKSKETVTHIIQINKKREFKTPIHFDGDQIDIEINFFDGENLYKSEKYSINDTNISTYKNTGIFKWKRKPKIKVLHLQTTLDLPKEINSRNQLSTLVKYGWEYVLHQNKPYEDLPPMATCLRPECVSEILFPEDIVQKLGTALTPAHYGCYESFKLGILSEFSDDIDFLIVCEGDCKIDIDINIFVTKVEEACRVIKDRNIGYMSFGDTHTLEHGWLQSPIVEEIPDTDVFITNHIIGLQCIMFPQLVKKYLFEQLRNAPWDGADMYFNTIFKSSPYKMGIVKSRYTTQFDGYSLIDQQEKKFI